MKFHRTHHQNSHRAMHTPSRGFTIIELLVVTAIIITLLSILIVAVNAATKASQKTNTAALMDSIKKGLVRFKEDMGYIPPVLGVPYTTNGPGGAPAPDELRRLFPRSVPNPMPGAYSSGSYSDHMQQYYSTCTLADYLVGYGDHYQDGFGVTGQAFPSDWASETPPAGIRGSGVDGVWGATSVGLASADYGKLSMRMKWQTGSPPTTANSYSPGLVTSPYPIDQGKVFGPYVELKDERLLAAVYYGPNGLETFFKGDVLPAGQTWDTLPKAIVDYWGIPIRYYRRPYPAGALSQSYRALPGQNFAVPTLSDVFVLRPYEIKPGEDISGNADPLGDQATTQRLSSAEFALMSLGPDKRADDAVRRDDQPNGQHINRYNADNIVEVGP